MWTVLQLTVQEASILNKMKKTTFELFAPPGEMFLDTSIASHYHDPQPHTSGVSGKTHRTRGYVLRVASAVSRTLLPRDTYLHTAAFLKGGEVRHLSLCTIPLSTAFSRLFFWSLLVFYIRGKKCPAKSERPPLSTVNPASHLLEEWALTGCIFSKYLIFFASAIQMQMWERPDHGIFAARWVLA